MDIVCTQLRVFRVENLDNNVQNCMLQQEVQGPNRCNVEILIECQERCYVVKPTPDHLIHFLLFFILIT